MATNVDGFYAVVNPNFKGADFDSATRLQPISAADGLTARWSPLARNGLWKVREFLFDPAKWGSAETCEQWVNEHKAEFASHGMPINQTVTFEVQLVDRDGAGADKTVPTEEEYERIKQFALDPDNAPPRENYYVRSMRLTNDQWSRSKVLKLSRGFQQSLMADAPGKSLLIGHSAHKGFPAEPIGLFFDGYEERENGTTWGVTKFFMPRTSQNEHARAMMDSGAWRYVSVGMKLDWAECSICGNNIMDAKLCKHVPGQAYPRTDLAAPDRDVLPDPADPENRVLCGMVYRGTGSMLEGSIVYLPELQGTRLVSLDAALASGDLETAKRMILDAGDSEDGSGAASAGEQSGDGATSAEPDTIQKGGDNMAEDKTAELQAALDAKATEADELAGKVTALEADVSERDAKIAALETAIANDACLRDSVVKDVDRLAALVQRDAELEAFKAAFGDSLETMPADKLLGLQARWLEIVDGMHSGRQSTPSEPGEVVEQDAADEPAQPVRARLSVV